MSNEQLQSDATTTASPLAASTAAPLKTSRTILRRSLIAGGIAACGFGGWSGWRAFQSWQFLSACDSFRKQKDWRSLRKSAREWVAWDPNAATGWWRAAQAAQEMEDLEDLAFCLSRIPSTDENFTAALVEKANLEWTVLNRPLEALETSRLALARTPGLVEIHSRLISFYAMTLQRTRMIGAIRNAMSCAAEPKEAYSYLIMSDILTFVNGDDINSRWLAACPDESLFKVALGVHTAMNVAQVENSNTSPEIRQLSNDARQQIQWFLDKLPGNPALLGFLLHQAYVRGDADAMAKLLQQVDDQSADDHMIWVYRAWYHSAVGELNDADESIQEAMRLHPLSPLARHEYTELLRKRQDADVAAQQRIAAYGRELRSQIMQLKSAADLTPELTLQIQSYAAACGDQQVEAAAKTRLRNVQIHSA